MSDYRKIAYSLLKGAPSKGEKRKVDIINATIQSINELGIEKTTFESIGKYIGIGKAHVAYHFKKKEDLILAAIELISLNAQDYISKQLEGAKDPKKYLLVYIDAHRKWIEDYKEHAVLFTLFFHYCTYNSDYQKIYQQVRDIGKLRITNLISLYAPNRKKADVDLLVITVQQLIQSALIDCVIQEVPPKTIFTQLKKQIKQIV